METTELEEQLSNFDFRVQNNGLESAEEWARSRFGDEAEQLIATYWYRIGTLTTGTGLVADDHKPWYFRKPDVDSPRWTHAKKQLGLPEPIVERTSHVADEILARLGNPRAESITTRGLVLGHVQSGKTTSYLSVAAKAADAGYHLIIILAGVHNSLRRQTQVRAERTLVHRENLWWVGTKHGDFRPDGNPVSSHLNGHGKRGLLVVKKHPTILERLADWLEAESDASLSRLAVLVIDDEADQAGLDVSSGDQLEGVHKQLSRIVNLRTSDDKRRCAYLAYTATPYANILTSQDDYGLYPRDFIYPLERPDGYVGAAQLFGEEQIGRPIELERDDSDEALTDGLRDAIRWFVVATAARAGLGSSLESFHSSMLIHTTQKIDDQVALRPVVEGYLRALAEEFERDPSVMARFYDDMVRRVPAAPGGGDGVLDEVVAPWENVSRHVPAVLERLIQRTPSGEPFVEDGHRQLAHSGVIVDNSKVDWIDRLTYSNLSAGEPSVTVIAIGGNTLSRGLTLEGLVCSYFARTAGTYDSLMQMGRWFGYRPGYRHLVRIWTTPELLDRFRELNTVEEELRQELFWMQEKGLTPDKYGPRIRVSPNMNITRPAAIRSVTRHISYSDTVIDPAWLDLDEGTLEHNEQVARSLAERVGQRDPDVGPSKLFRGVPLEVVADFLFSFRFHPNETRIDIPSLERYIDREVGALRAWSVAFKSVARANLAPFDFGGAVGEVIPVSRARVRDSSIAYIQSLIAPNDHRLDTTSDTPLGEARYRSPSEPPLLVVYAIDPRSEPLRKDNRAALNAPRTPISLSVALPKSASEVDYVAPAVTSVEQYKPDLGDLERD